MPQNKVVSLNDQKPNTHASQEFLRLATIGHEDDEIDLMALASTLWRGKWVILLLVLLAVCIGGYYAYGLATPKYTTTAAVALDPQQQNVTDIASVMSGLSGDQATINTEVEVIRSRKLMKKLVRKLSLTKDPEFNTSLKPANPYAVIPFIKDQLGLTKPEKVPSDAAILDATVDSLLKAISVSNKRQSYVFNITTTTESPEKSALLANTLSDLYILDQLDVKFQATQQATKWLTGRVAELKVKLEDAVNKVKDFNAQAELVSPEGLAALQRQVKEARDRIKKAEAGLVSEQKHIKALEDAQQNGDPEQMAALANEGILNRVLVLLRADSIDRDVFDQAFATFLQRTKLEYGRTASQTAALKTSATQLEGQIGRQSSDLVKLQQLQQEAAASQTIYDYFLKRLKETTVQQGIQKADSRVLSQAVVPILASAPKKALILALSGILGLFAGAGIVLGREMLQNGLRTAEDLESATGYTVMGQIPIMPVKRRVDVLSYLIKKSTSSAAESVRNLRTSVLLSDVDNPPRVIMITSSMPSEGKTTASLALSQNLAGLGKRVLLVEGDIRRRTFSQYFNIKNQHGILAVISGEASLEDAIYRDPKLGFDVLVGEKSSTNAADVFSSEKFHGFLAEMREIYDYIVIDTPPVLVVPDARVIAQSVDAVLYSVKWDATPKSQVLYGLKMFETVNTPVTGLILAQIDPKGLKRYGYGGKYGGYYGYYAKGYYDN